MIRKVKNWLGIEGVKSEIQTPEKTSDNPISGILRLSSKSRQQVKSASVTLIEKYTRGRRKNKRIDEYVLGRVAIDHTEVIEMEDYIDIPFELPYRRQLSPIQSFASKNFLNKGIGALAEWSKGVKVEYRLEAEANIRGNAIKPLSVKPIELA